MLSSQVAPQMTWPQAMGMCVLYGVVIMLLVVTGLREMIMNAIPLALKHGITMGIGLFIALIGFYKSGFVHQGKATPLTLGPAGELAGWPVLLFAYTLLLIFMLQARNMPGAILIGIITGTVVASVLNAAGVIAPKQWASGAAPELHGSAVSMPDFSLFGHVEFGGWGKVGAMTVGMIVFTLVLAGFFDAMATIIGVGTEAELADDKGRMPGLSKALFIDGAGARSAVWRAAQARPSSSSRRPASARAPERASPPSSRACSSRPVSSSPRSPRSSRRRSRPPPWSSSAR